jgi:hypothetical protein
MIERNISNEIDAMARAYFALRDIPPIGRDAALDYLISRLSSERPQEQRAALAFARASRKLRRVL